MNISIDLKQSSSVSSKKARLITDPEQENENVEVNEFENVKLKREIPKTKSSKLLKSYSLNLQPSQLLTLDETNPSEKFLNNSIYREKLKLIVAKNQKLLINNNQKDTVLVKNPEKIKTLKQALNMQRIKKKQSLTSVVEVLAEQFVNN